MHESKITSGKCAIGELTVGMSEQQLKPDMHDFFFCLFLYPKIRVANECVEAC